MFSVFNIIYLFRVYVQIFIMRELKEVMKTKPMERDSLQVKHSFPDSNQGDQTSTESLASVCNAGEQQMLQTPVKIEVKPEEIKEENTAEEPQTLVKIEVKQEEIKENTAEEQQRTDEDDKPQMLQTSVKLVDCRNLIKRRGETTAVEQESDEDDVIHSGEGALQMDLDSDEEFTLSSEDEQDSEDERLHFEERLEPAEDAILDDYNNDSDQSPVAKRAKRIIQASNRQSTLSWKKRMILTWFHRL
ncbi:gelsolin-related protein of 125 kDa-like [Xyrauchen texanus]|uniref:gelsolin-related protein of 125 kDa-like n=1 Tax=Xyrauchen texanus TaxID=154827 RepID=UPI002241D8B7|nr:gelsolin-related protein of 125 kDa-like [Xyrauchen texanus]